MVQNRDGRTIPKRAIIRSQVKSFLCGSTCGLLHALFREQKAHFAFQNGSCHSGGMCVVGHREGSLLSLNFVSFSWVLTPPPPPKKSDADPDICVSDTVSAVCPNVSWSDSG